MNGWVRRCGVASVALVALVAAIVSYSHMHDLAERAGEGWRSWLEPLSVDGLLVGASLVLTVRRRAPLAVLAVVVGILVSLAANLAAASPDPIARLVAAWPAVALALSYETLLSLVHRPAGGPAPTSHQDPPVDETHEHDPLFVEVVRLVEADPQVGRPTVARELNISEHKARELLNQVRANGHQPVATGHQLPPGGEQ